MASLVEGLGSNHSTANGHIGPTMNPYQKTESDKGTDKERREHIRHLQKEAFQLANYYFVFQGVIFTAFYGIPSSVKCRNRWIPFTLSFVAGFLNLCTLLSILLKYKSLLDELDLTSTNSGEKECNLVKCERWRRQFYVMFVMVLFIVFFLVILIRSLTITCDHD